jgi:hypothetical protein
MPRWVNFRHEVFPKGQNVVLCVNFSCICAEMIFQNYLLFQKVRLEVFDILSLWLFADIVHAVPAFSCASLDGFYFHPSAVYKVKDNC